uniref:Carboxypeptidase regulatory-like domain-containing protein n=1 Tax=Solibacter usitatus (strain Ellin6076) TaxID=234267 RepID=Q02BY4_SOLUE
MRVLSLILALWIPAAAQVAPMLNLVVVEGEGAVNNIRQRTAREPVVQVEDENHKPVAGAIVVFMLPSNGAGGTFANGAKTLTMTTDSKGQAVARGLKPNGVKGQYQIRVNASHNGQTASISITQTNAILSANGATSSSAISGKLIAVLAVVGAAAAGGAYYATHNGGGATPVPPTSGTTISAGAGSVGPPR